MAISSQLDRLHRAVERVFGAPADNPDTLDGVPVQGIYDAPYADPLDMATSMPSYHLRTAAVQAQVGSELACCAGIFRVRAVEPDGVGWTVLRLERLS
jgi:hypothetical protein